MKATIVEQLHKLEKEHEIKVLYAVESGSRAWGFASTNSDRDVRYIYVHRPEWYLSIDDKKDSKEVMLPGDLDLSGWELRKALRLFRKSNPPLLEWLRSPMVYIEEGPLAESLRALSKEYFKARYCLHHYLHMAEGNYREYLQQEVVRSKKYFYVLRPVLACEWIEKTHTMAPMEFEVLLNEFIGEGILRNDIESLLNQKRNGEEMGEGPRINSLNDYLENRLSYYQELVKSYDKSDMPDSANLNRLFRTTVEQSWQY